MSVRGDRPSRSSCSEVCEVYFHADDLSKKPYSAYLAISVRLLLLDRDFMKSVPESADIKVARADAITFWSLTPREIRHVMGGIFDRFTMLPGCRAVETGMLQPN